MVIDVLFAGSVLNANNFILEDQSCVDIRVREPSQILSLTRASIKSISEKHSSFAHHIVQHSNSLLRTMKRFPLDYIINFKKQLIPYKIRSKTFHEFLGRRNILKNIVFQILLEIRRIKAKPKLSELLKMFKNKTNQQEKERFIEKMKMLFQAKDMQK